MSRWFSWLRGRDNALIEDSAWQALRASSALFDQLDAASDAQLRALAGRFLARKSFAAAGGHELTPPQCLAIAALSCLPVLHRGFDWLAGWSQVIVYPGAFKTRREHHDESTGVVTEFDDALIGEAWEQGPLILSWADVEADLAAPFEGFNVVVHEIAHKLDLLDGAMDGTPRLPSTLRSREWIGAMQPAFDAHVRAVERGRDTLIDPYAAECVEEFFAVTSELHFSDPHTLQRAAPAVAVVLAKLYGPAP